MKRQAPPSRRKVRKNLVAKGGGGAKAVWVKGAKPVSTPSFIGRDIGARALAARSLHGTTPGCLPDHPHASEVQEANLLLGLGGAQQAAHVVQRLLRTTRPLEG